VIRKFESFIRQNELFSSTDKIILAVSGGMDSMVMAELFHRAGYNFAIAHCNFKLRGKDSDDDEAIVKQTALQYGVTCYCRSFDTANISNESRDSIQMTARTLRYNYFYKLATENNYDYIATGHHLDDQNETFFINLVRGCGIAGLHGIRIKQDKVIRPLMFAFRRGLEEFANENKIAYREDDSNSSLKYMRNNIRHQLMPLLRELNPRIEKEMRINISRLADTEKVFQQQIELKRNEIVETQKDKVLIDIKKLKALQPLNTFLFEFISPYGFKGEDVENIIPLLEDGSGKEFFSFNFHLLIDREKIIVSPQKREDDLTDEYLIREDQHQISEPLFLEISIRDRKEYTIPNDKIIGSFNFDLLRFPLTLRHWRKGDSFVPLGMNNKKKLSDFFIDEKFSLLEKEETWILCSGNDIIWIVGHRIDNRYKLSPGSQKVYRIELGKKY